MPINHLYHTWIQRIRALRPSQRITQVRNMTWLVIGIYQSRSVSLSRVAGQIPGAAKLLSTTRRMSRLLANPAIRVRKWYAPIARQWLMAQARHSGEIRLLVDGTKVGYRHQLLMVSVAYRRRAIPIAWTWVPYVRGHSAARTQLALFAYVAQLLPEKTQVSLVGDSEFGAVAVLRQLDTWGWHYVLRQKGHIHTRQTGRPGWQSFASWVDKPGQSRWLGAGFLTAKEAYPTQLLVHWKVGEAEPWCLATNLPTRRQTLRYYKRRMWIDEMFGDLKKHGFDLESTMLRHFLRLSRLTLAVALLYVWLLSVGTRTVHAGLRPLIDRRERRDLCIFQIGLRFIERRLINGLSFRIPLCTYR